VSVTVVAMDFEIAHKIGISVDCSLVDPLKGGKGEEAVYAGFALLVTLDRAARRGSLPEGRASGFGDA